MHLFPLFPVGLKARYISSMPFICLSYRRKHNLSTCHRLYTVQSKTTLFKLFLAAFLQLRNPELCGSSDACSGSLTTRTGSPTGNEINKNSIPRQKVQQRLGCFSGEMVSTEWYVQVKTQWTLSAFSHCTLLLWRCVLCLSPCFFSEKPEGTTATVPTWLF